MKTATNSKLQRSTDYLCEMWQEQTSICDAAELFGGRKDQSPPKYDMNECCDEANQSITV